MRLSCSIARTELPVGEKHPRWLAPFIHRRRRSPRGQRWKRLACVDDPWSALELVSYSSLRTLPSSLSRLTKLRILNISCNDFEDLPQEILSLDNLEILGFSGTNLSGLPSKIGRLTKLTALYIRANKLSTVRALTGLPMLRSLDLRLQPANRVSSGDHRRAAARREPTGGH